MNRDECKKELARIMVFIGRPKDELEAGDRTAWIDELMRNFYDVSAALWTETVSIVIERMKYPRLPLLPQFFDAMSTARDRMPKRAAANECGICGDGKGFTYWYGRSKESGLIYEIAKPCRACNATLLASIQPDGKLEEVTRYEYEQQYAGRVAVDERPVAERLGVVPMA